ncbi:unnamed protein product [Lactuca saligna]|uniref:HAT C-terminal dimerisation domain-containing protein n=1 Tax=Lactuca saligna TaxID=75948 RepID=A0AA36EAL2_LACSI|nr:unnamed protein product [Lactuca saligna]
MAIVLRYVDNRGVVKERFIRVVHVKDTSSLTLKVAIDDVFTRNNLSMSQVRGQGYDGASNMRGAFNGLKALILKDNDSAHYVHCFTHQLQLVIVGVEKKHDGVDDFFEQLSLVVNVRVKPRELAYSSERYKMGFTFQNHHKFDELISGDFVFYLHLMYEILHLTNVLSKHLQKKDQDILEAASLVRGIMDALKSLRDMGFAKLVSKHPIARIHGGFDKTKLLKLSELYTKDFDDVEMMQLDGELEIYYHALHKDGRFTSLQGISDLSCLMVETGTHRSYPMVYRLLKLVLVLPVATAMVERCFSAMKFLKTDLHNKIGDDFLNDVMISYVEKEALMKVKIEDVMDRFQKCVPIDVKFRY